MDEELPEDEVVDALAPVVLDVLGVLGVAADEPEPVVVEEPVVDEDEAVAPVPVPVRPSWLNAWNTASMKALKPPA